MYRPQHFIHNLTQRPRQTVAVRRDKPFDDITEEELEQVLTSVSGVPDVTKHECWWVSGDFCVRAFDAPVYRAAELDDDLEHWDKDCIVGVKRVGWVVMYDITSITHLCAFQQDMWYEYLYPFVEFDDPDVSDERREEVEEAQRESTVGFGDYKSASSMRKIEKFVEDDNRGLNACPSDPEITREQEWEEQREHWSINYPL